MNSHERTLALVFACLSRINDQLPKAERIAASEDTVLVGPGGLESLTLINLLVEIEEALHEATGTRVQLLDEALAGAAGARFSTVRDLVGVITKE